MVEASTRWRVTGCKVAAYVVAGVLDTNGSITNQAEFEVEDRRREEEEADFLLLPEEVDRWAGGERVAGWVGR